MFTFSPIAAPASSEQLEFVYITNESSSGVVACAHVQSAGCVCVCVGEAATCKPACGPGHDAGIATIRCWVVTIDSMDMASPVKMDSSFLLTPFLIKKHSTYSKHQNKWILVKVQRPLVGARSVAARADRSVEAVVPAAVAAPDVVAVAAGVVVVGAVAASVVAAVAGARTPTAWTASASGTRPAAARSATATSRTAPT